MGRRGAHGEKIFWSRGNGWTYAGLARMLTLLPPDSAYRGLYTDLFLKMSRKIAALQKPDGSWPPSLLDPRVGTPPETSGTGFFTYGLAWGVKAGLLKDDMYRRAAERGWNALARAVRPDGKLGWVQQQDAEPNAVRAEDTQPFGVGAFLLAGTAMYDLTRHR
jgi:rhamnogalacturonyl hydrolase YesR